MGTPMKGYPKWYFQIVSGFIDCDRLDYLKRDGIQTGMPQIRIQRILMNSLIVNDELTFDKKVAHDILQVAQTRQYYHYAIYQHKTVLKYNLMVLDLMRKNKKHFGLDTMFKNDKWIFFTDSQFWSKVYDLMGEDQLADDILNRKLYKIKVTDVQDVKSPPRYKASINLGGGKNSDIISQIKFHKNGKLVKLSITDLALRPQISEFTRYCYDIEKHSETPST
jgi:HD superfamily phosphohydrolase